MKFLILVVVAAIAAVATVSANPDEHKQYQQQQQQQRYNQQQQQKQMAGVQGRANQEQLNEDKIDMIDTQAREFDEHMGLERAKKSYGPSKCGKAIVVGCGPIVKKVKCKGGYKGAYTENVPQYAKPEEEYEDQQYIKYF